MYSLISELAKVIVVRRI